jgi:uncharacterized protein (TIGR00369 family)
MMIPEKKHKHSARARIPVGRCYIGRVSNDTSVSNDSLAALKEFMKGQVPYWQMLGLELKEVAPGRAVFEAAVREGHMQNGVVHGGVLASIADSACAVAGISMVFPAGYATTINLQLSYLKAVTQGRFRAEGKCLKAGRNLLFCEADVRDEGGTLVCTASSQLMVISLKK